MIGVAVATGWPLSEVQALDFDQLWTVLDVLAEQNTGKGSRGRRR